MSNKLGFIALTLFIPLAFMCDTEASMFERMMDVAAYCLVWFLLIFLPNFWVFVGINIIAIVIEYISNIPLLSAHVICFLIAALAIMYGGYKTKNLSRNSSVYIPNPKPFYARCNQIYTEFRTEILTMLK